MHAFKLILYLVKQQYIYTFDSLDSGLDLTAGIVVVADSTAGVIQVAQYGESFSFQQVPVANVQSPIAIDFDPDQEKIYWTDTASRGIFSSYLDGTEERPIIQFDAQSESGVFLI